MKKEFFPICKRLMAIVLMLLVMTLSACSPSDNVSSNPSHSGTPSGSIHEDSIEGTVVYITETGEKYHREHCQYLSRSKIPISLEDALSQGYERCSRCKPPREA